MNNKMINNDTGNKSVKQQLVGKYVSKLQKQYDISGGDDLDNMLISVFYAVDGKPSAVQTRVLIEEGPSKIFGHDGYMAVYDDFNNQYVCFDIKNILYVLQKTSSGYIVTERKTFSFEDPNVKFYNRQNIKYSDLSVI